jgi:hypothetical protein
MVGARAVVLALALLVGCGPRINGAIRVDGKPFAVRSCRVGAVRGFFGVDIVSREGGFVRLVYDPSGQAAAYLFSPGAATGVALGLCGPMALVNYSVHARGSATLSCRSPEHSLEGELRFDRCRENAGAAPPERTSVASTSP